MSTENAPREHGGHDVHANGMDIHHVEAGAGEPLVVLENGMISINPFSARPTGTRPHPDPADTRRQPRGDPR